MQSVITILKKRFSISRLWLIILSFFMVSISSGETDLGGTTFGDWLVQCIPVPVSEEGISQNLDLECVLSQRIDFEGSNEPLLKIDLYLNPRISKPEAVFVLPLGIPLASAPVLSFDGANKLSLAVSHCHNDGCYFKAPLDSRLLEAFLSVQTAQVRLRGNDNETVEIPISGRGSRAAYNYFEAIPKE